MAAPWRILVPLGFAVAAGAATAATALLSRTRHTTATLDAPKRPLALHGWWDADDASPLAYAHPAVLFVDAASGALLDSWDRRSRMRVVAPYIRRVAAWPASGIVVLDADSGDLLASLAGTTPAG